jgi:hypothetical protein
MEVKVKVEKGIRSSNNSTKHESLCICLLEYMCYGSSRIDAYCSCNVSNCLVWVSSCGVYTLDVGSSAPSVWEESIGASG